MTHQDHMNDTNGLDLYEVKYVNQQTGEDIRIYTIAYSIADIENDISDILEVRRFIEPRFYMTESTLRRLRKE